MKVGFIGLGIMGKPMAGHLIAGGHELYLHSRSGGPAELAAKGKACKSAKEVAQQAEVIFVMVPDTPDVKKALFDENGVAAGLGKGKVVVDMSSISPIETKRFAKRINDLGCKYLDAPVSGGEVGAKAASLTIMVGGDAATFAKGKPLFALLGKMITLVGATCAKGKPLFELMGKKLRPGPAHCCGQPCPRTNYRVFRMSVGLVGEALVF